MKEKLLRLLRYHREQANHADEAVAERHRRALSRIQRTDTANHFFADRRARLLSGAA